MIVLLLGTLGLVFFISFRIHQLQYTTALTLFMVYAALLGVTLSSIFLTLHRRVDHAGVLHLGGLVRRAEPVGLHHAARPLGDGLVPDHGPVRHHHRELVNIFLKSSGLDWIISVIGVGVFAGLTAYDTQRIKEMYNSMDDDGTMRPQGRDGRAVALPRLHQPVPDAAAPGRRPALSRTSTETGKRPGLSPGRFLLALMEYAGHDCRLDPPGHARRHPRHHAHLRPCGDARHRLVRARAAGRGRNGAPACTRCSTAAFPISRPRSAARWPATPMPAPTAPRPAYRFSVEDSIYVDPGAQRSGVGRALLARLIEECERRGFAR